MAQITDSPDYSEVAYTFHYLEKDEQGHLMRSDSVSQLKFLLKAR